MIKHKHIIINHHAQSVNAENRLIVKFIFLFEKYLLKLQDRWI